MGERILLLQPYGITYADAVLLSLGVFFIALVSGIIDPEFRSLFHL